MEPETNDDSNRYGVWPGLAGYLAGAAIIALMFALATGML